MTELARLAKERKLLNFEIAAAENQMDALAAKLEALRAEKHRVISEISELTSGIHVFQTGSAPYRADDGYGALDSEVIV